MKPYIEFEGKRYYLPQEVNAHRFEMNVMEQNGKNYFLLCPKVKKRYVQASGALMEPDLREMKFLFSGSRLAKASFPLGKYETLEILIDYKAASATPVSMASTDEEAE